MYTMHSIGSRLPVRQTLAFAILFALLLTACAANPAPEAAPPATSPPGNTEAPAESRVPTPTTAPAAEEEPAPPSATAVPLDQVQLELIPVAEQLQNPLFVTHAGDGSGRLFLVEKPGLIRILRDGQLLDAPFLDIRDRVGSSGSEQGLLGLAFPPDYAETGHFFVNYTDAAGDTRIARFTTEPGAPDMADTASEFPILHLAQPAAQPQRRHARLRPGWIPVHRHGRRRRVL